jgi:hypothetical protein
MAAKEGADCVYGGILAGRLLQVKRRNRDAGLFPLKVAALKIL